MRKVFLLAVIFSLVAVVAYAAFQVTVKYVYPGTTPVGNSDACRRMPAARMIDSDAGVMAVSRNGGVFEGEIISVEATTCVTLRNGYQYSVYKVL